MTDKQEKTPEIVPEVKNAIEKQAERQDKSTQSDLTLQQIADLQTASSTEVKPKGLLPTQDVTPDPLFPLVQLQAVIRGCAARIQFASFKQLQPQAIKEVPVSISTVEARQAYARLPPFKFEKPAGDEPVNWKGPTRLADGSVYVGEWSNKGVPHGKGIMYYIDGGICEGYWREGKLHDRGRRVSPKGDVYVGGWVNGKMQGQGIMEYASKSVYSGSWLDDKQHGFGAETWPDGSRFEGQYKEGSKAGKGKFSWTDGSKYEGEFLNDVIEGFGKYTWSNKEYEGYWKAGKMNGRGLFKWNDGKVYEGEYVNDLKEGYGVLKWPDGKKYEGMWKDGKFNGEGTMSQRGKKRKGIWENGEFKQKLRD
jgi:hypothetical protein